MPHGDSLDRDSNWILMVRATRPHHAPPAEYTLHRIEYWFMDPSLSFCNPLIRDLCELLVQRMYMLKLVKLYWLWLILLSKLTINDPYLPPPPLKCLVDQVILVRRYIWIPIPSLSKREASISLYALATIKATGALYKMIMTTTGIKSYNVFYLTLCQQSPNLEMDTYSDLNI
ncbi:hypothetical protein G9A89_000690 [Geosiphon pyriformis]|nr:hypothetical protein G9A89_000690 [Geosiphon pyriformis]